ncbi:hypothetical protein PMAYCL1PPCAC_10843, partial [Pristionchus mayeri]
SILYLVAPTFVFTANQKLLNALLNESNYVGDVRPMNANGGPLVITIIPNKFFLLTIVSCRLPKSASGYLTLSTIDRSLIANSSQNRVGWSM